MHLNELYQFCIQEGLKEDPRSKADVRASLALAKKNYQKLSARERKYFDQELLAHPYADTRILFGSPSTDVRRVLVGIDIGPAEMLLADQLNQRGLSIDLVISHHPLGMALSGLSDVMRLQTDLLKDLGVDSRVAGQLMGDRIDEVARSVHSANHDRVIDAARLLKIPLMCCHTPADNHVVRYLERKMADRKPKRLAQLIDLLFEEPEYQHAAKLQAGPRILIGNEKDHPGKIMVDMTGGTEGSKEVFGRLSQAGVKTIVGMHLSEAHYKKAKAEFLNVVIAGHMASDNLGLNLLFDKLTKKNKRLEILACSGFWRVARSWA